MKKYGWELVDYCFGRTCYLLGSVAWISFDRGKVLSFPVQVKGDAREVSVKNGIVIEQSEGICR